MDKMLVPGQKLQMGKYCILKQIASGGFGNTYEVKNLYFDERYAMKEFFMKGINERDDNATSISVSNKDNREQFHNQLEKFKKEARRLRNLHNEHIVQVFDLFEENGTAYYVMDFVDGESLSHYLKKRSKPFKEDDVLQILSQVLDALGAVHEKNIWHLDLKPANIMMDKSGRVKLIDFGASKQMSSKDGYTSTMTSMCYTAGYAPTEQIEQNVELIGPWTDIYSLGATLYNLLTNNQPPTISEMFGADAFSYSQPVSDKTKYLVRWMMKPNRQSRPQSVQEIRDFLDKPFNEEIYSEKGQSSEEEKTVLGNTSKRKKESSSKKLLKERWFPWAVGASVLFVGLIIFLLLGGKGGETIEIDSDKVDSMKTSISSAIDKKVEKMFFESPLGVGSYSGEIDTIRKPHGNGELIFTDGRIYRGPFVHGKLEGKNAYFKYDNGDTFEGSFVNNGFSEGKYTIKDDGSYFIGTFKNGQPDKGQWHSANGKLISKSVNIKDDPIIKTMKDNIGVPELWVEEEDNSVNEKELEQERKAAKKRLRELEKEMRGDNTRYTSKFGLG